MIRTDARDEYSETNTIFSKSSKRPPTSLADSDKTIATRIQFYAYEIARNRLGLNDKAHEIAIEEAAKEKAKAEKEKAKKGGKS